MPVQPAFVASSLVGVYQTFTCAVVDYWNSGFIGGLGLGLVTAADGFEHRFDRGAHGRAAARIMLTVFFRLPGALFRLSRVGQVKTPIIN